NVRGTMPSAFGPAKTYLGTGPSAAENGCAENPARDFRRPRRSTAHGTRAQDAPRGDPEAESRLVRVERREWTRGSDRARRRRGISPKVTDTDPHEIGETIHESEPLESAAKVTAKAVNAFTKQSYKILKSHPVNRARAAKGEPPANAVVLRGAGVFPELVPITERFHLTAAGIAGVALIRGMFRTIGMDVIEVPGATGGLDTDMIAKADAALEALRTHDLVVLHVKAPDLCGHDGNASEKIRVIERMDAMMGHLKAMLSSEVVVALTADHSTPV